MGFSLVQPKNDTFATMSGGSIPTGTIVSIWGQHALCVAPGRFAWIYAGDELRVPASAFWAYPAMNADCRSVSPAPGPGDADFDAVGWENGILTVRAR